MSTNQTIKSHATTREYTENYQQTDMAKVELGRYCAGCGRLPAWCECVQKYVGAAIRNEQKRPERRACECADSAKAKSK